MNTERQILEIKSILAGNGISDDKRFELTEKLYSLEHSGVNTLYNNNMETRKQGNKETIEQGNNTYIAPKTSWTIDELLSMEFTEPAWIVDGMIPIGLSILSGRPKLGKSYLCMQLCNAVGGSLSEFLGVSIVSKFPCLYMALEDRADRLQKRIKEQDFKPGANVRIEQRWKDMFDGGLEMLEAEIKDCGFKLIIIDTLTRIVSLDSKNRTEQTKYIYGRLQEIAFNNNAAIIVVEHHRKPAIGGIQSVIDDVISDTAKTAVADAIIGLYRGEGEDQAKLKVVSRDAEYLDLTIEMNFAIMTWELIGRTKDVLDTSNQERVRDVLQQNEDDGMTHKQITNATGIPKGTVTKTLKKLREKGRIRLEGDRYFWIEEIDF